MKIHNYPFTTLRGIARPMLWVRLSSLDGKKRSEPILAKIDTGSDACIFPFDVLYDLGHKLRPNEEAMSIGSTTGTGKGYSREVMLDILETLPDGSAGSKVIYNLPKVVVYFVWNNKNQFLLGAKDFLDHFVLTLDYKKRSFSLVP